MSAVGIGIAGMAVAGTAGPEFPEVLARAVTIAAAILLARRLLALREQAAAVLFDQGPADPDHATCLVRIAGLEAVSSAVGSIDSRRPADTPL